MTCRCRVTVTERCLRWVERELRAHPGAIVEVATGVRRAENTVELLVPAADPAGTPAEPGLARFALLAPALEGITHQYWHRYGAAGASTRPRVDVALYQGRGCSAALLDGGQVRQIDELFIAGPRMERWIPAEPPRDLVGTVPVDGPFSRYVGALGGDAVHERLRATRAAGVGMARLNSLMATALARAGVRRLDLVDPDRLDDHSLDAVEAFAGSCGRPKVEAVAAFLRKVAPAVQIQPIATLVDSAPAFAACAASDLVFSAPDQNRARLIAALCAIAYHRIHLDLGTGVFARGGEFLAGADVRLVLPGDGCLLCVGGLDLNRPQEPDWRRQRAGSLRSLNGLAASIGMLLLERLFTGDLVESTWVQMTVDRSGSVQTERVPRHRVPDCVLCALAGQGDAALLSL